MSHDVEPNGGPWSLLFDLLAVSAGSGAILLVLRALGLTLPLLRWLGLT